MIKHGKAEYNLRSDNGSYCAFSVYNDIDDETFFSVKNEERESFCTAGDCIHHPSFQKLFSSQVIGDASLFSIARVVLVFTDVDGSTALYEHSGNGAAFRAVKKHFEILFDAVLSSGRVVKTLGDYVMAAFSSGEAAIQAAGQALDGISEHCVMPNGKPLQIRVGMRAGEALMVPLNGINDYFGSTVNVAASVESKAQAIECLISQSVLSDPDAAVMYNKILENGYCHTRTVDLSMKGVPFTVKAQGFQSTKSSVTDNNKNIKVSLKEDTNTTR